MSYSHDELVFCSGYKALTSNGAVVYIRSIRAYRSITNFTTLNIYVNVEYPHLPTQGGGYAQLPAADIVAIPIFDTLQNTKLGKLLFFGEFSVKQ